ncbi:MAG TPA: proton-conducting transporter membrane subunit [Candidatus Lokiarchaeia archaeon]|nr:proton-conducting transporter membrane subunit [Candidatus Lokiarchaeia archaeon]
MAVNLVDVVLPVISFVGFSLLTVPVVSMIRKSKANKTALMLLWFAVVYLTSLYTVISLALNYYTDVNTSPFLIIAMTDNPSLVSFSSSFFIDALAIYMSILFVAISAVVFLYTIFVTNLSERPAERYFAVMLLITGSLIGSIFAGDLLTLFIFWEASAGAVSFLILFEKTAASLRATLKYLIMIIIASSFIVYGLSIIFGITGTLNYWAVKDYLLATNDKSLLTLAFIFIAAGYATEAAVVPFHMWLPDAYAAAPAASSAFISSVIDQGSYYILVRVFIYILTPPGVIEWRVMMAILSALTMIVANLLALVEKNVKRLFALICIADVGYNLIAITSTDPVGIMGNLYFFLNGGITIALAFMCVGIFNHLGIKTVQDFRGIGHKMPYTSIALVLGTLSFAGFPPMAGFIAKYLVFTAAVEANMAWLAIIGVLMSVVQAAYLILLYTDMFAKVPGEVVRMKEPLKLLIPIYILLGAIIIFGIFPEIVLTLIDPVAKQFQIILNGGFG